MLDVGVEELDKPPAGEVVGNEPLGAERDALPGKGGRAQQVEVLEDGAG